MSNLVPIKGYLNAVLLVCLQYHPKEFPRLQDAALYTRKNARSVTAFNSTDIKAEQDNVATPVLISGLLQSWCDRLCSIMLVTSCSYTAL